MNLKNAEEIRRSAESKMIETLESEQFLIERYKSCISSDLRELEKLIGREGVKRFLKDYPLPF